MPLYETVLIARQDISTTQVETLTEQFKNVITESGGSIAKTESWGLRTLAYKMNKNRKGHYVLINIVAEAPALHEMERQMRNHEDVMRHLTIRVDEHEEGPSMVIQNKDSGDRPRRPAPRRDDHSGGHSA